MFRTPAKRSLGSSPPTTPPNEHGKPDTFVTQTKVGRNMGEREAVKILFPEEITALPMAPSRLQEAKAWVTKAKIALNASRNLKTDIKATVTQAIDRLYQMIKEAEARKTLDGVASLSAICNAEEKGSTRESREKEKEAPKPQETVGKTEVSQLLSSLAEHSRLMRESNEKAEDLKEALQAKKESLEAVTYASVVASAKGRKRPVPTALHSVVVASRDEMETGEEVLGRIRKAINAKEEGINIDRVRKAKDRKIVIGCRSEEERSRVRNRIERDQKLEVQEVQNQDPLIILRDVLSFHKDEDVQAHLRTQNKKLFRDLPTGDDRIEIKFRRKARNALMCHIVAKVSPTLWNRMTGASEVYLDMQLIAVEDQSPLVQCSMCLGYGHSRRLCTETEEKCGHCGGPHHRKDCPDRLASAAPACCNCKSANLEETGHSAFSMDCPVRRRWDALARAKTAYC